MAEPFISEIRLFAFNFPPKGWAYCNGQLLAINQNQALFSLLGTTYGGNGVNNFALPNFQGRVAMHQGVFQGFNYVMGEADGEASHPLTTTELPYHGHGFTVGSTASGDKPQAGFFATPGVNARMGQLYSTTGGSAGSPHLIQSSGGNQPHSNLQPYLAVNFSIALYGIFPSRN